MDEDEDEEMLVVQTIIAPNRELLSRIFRRGWSHTEAENPFAIMPDNTTFMDPSLLFLMNLWPRRNTFIQMEDFNWEVVEHCVLYSSKESYAGEIDECKSKKIMVMTILHSKEEPLDDFCEVAGESIVPAGGSTLDSLNFMFADEPAVPQEFQDGMKPEEIDQLDQGRGTFKELEKNLRGQAEHITKFSLMMNHIDKLELVADLEPTMLRLRLCQNVSLMRQHLGFQTVISYGRPGGKGRTAQIERAIQTLRRQASTLLHMAEQKCELKLPGPRALVPWLYIHAA